MLPIYISIQTYVFKNIIRPLKRMKRRQFSSDRDFIGRRERLSAERRRSILCYEVDPKDLEGSHVPRISSRDPSTSPILPFSSDSPGCLPRREIYPFKWHVPTNWILLARKPTPRVCLKIQIQSRQTRVKKKRKKDFSPLSVIGLRPIYSDGRRFSFNCCGSTSIVRGSFFYG